MMTFGFFGFFARLFDFSGGGTELAPAQLPKQAKSWSRSVSDPDPWVAVMDEDGDEDADTIATFPLPLLSTTG